MRRALAFAVAVAASGSVAAAPAHRPAAARDWARVVAATAEGGFRMGNPAARVKLVEYGSLTCPHCAAFSREGAPKLVAGYVRTGKVSWEFRNYILNGIDVTASLVTRCSGANFFRMAETLYATQPRWMGRVTGLSQAEKDRLKALPEGQRLGAIADLAGITQVAGRYGVPAARARQCAANPAGLERLGRMVEAANAMGVQGTPTFFVNGAPVEGNTWEVVEAALKGAGG